MFLDETESDGQTWIGNADIGAVRPAGLDARARRAPAPEPVVAPAESGSSSEEEGAGYRYRTIRQSLQALTMGVPATRLYDLPLHWQRYVVGLPVDACRLLRKVGTLARYYADRHDDADD